MEHWQFLPICSFAASLSVPSVRSKRPITEYTNKPCMGYREVIKIHNEEKEVTKKVDGKEVKGELCKRSSVSLGIWEEKRVRPRMVDCRAAACGRKAASQLC